MSGAVHLHSSAYSRAAVARLGPALAASALMHLALLSAPLLDTPWRGVASYPGDAPITVRLAPVPVPVPDVPASPDPGVRRMPQQPGALAGSAERVQSQFFPSVAAHMGTEGVALPQAADPSYYTARDLDAYPRPIAPLEIDRFAVGNAALGRVSFALLIDEHGIVNDVAFVQSEPLGYADERLRGLLAAVRFVPAYKNGRAVKSRVVLSINFETSDR